MKTTPYNQFLTNLTNGDTVIVYSTRDGSSFNARASNVTTDEFEIGGELLFNSIGNGKGSRARGMKLLPANTSLPQGFTLTQAEAEELVG